MYFCIKNYIGTLAGLSTVKNIFKPPVDYATESSKVVVPVLLFHGLVFFNKGCFMSQRLALLFVLVFFHAF